MNEFDLIACLTRNLPQNGTVVTGVGDDCAVLDLGIPGRHLLFKTDAVVEGVHFTAETEPERIGYKALARCLSDIAAMGGEAGSALVTLALPPKYDVARVEKVYAGLNQLALRHQVAIAGGETTTNPGGMLISIAMIGTVAAGKAILRSGAKAGDAIFVTGELGGSLAGRHLDFEPRLAEAQWLAAHFPIHAMIDVSDGLAGDLRHILRQSHAGAELFGKSIPISRAAKLRARESSTAKPALVAALTDGEDFELLFTLPAGQAVPLLDGWKDRFPEVKLSCIGKVAAQPGIRLRDERGVRELGAGGYEHFGKTGDNKL
jgi:thiamine-monophosphate kinase